MLNRRNFLTGAVAFGSTLVLTPVLRAAPILEPIAEEAAALTIDPMSKTIFVNEPMTMIDFHRFLQDLWDEPDWITEQTPSLRITDHIIEMANGWDVDQESIGYLTNGCLRQDSDIWTSYVGEYSRGYAS